MQKYFFHLNRSRDLNQSPAPILRRRLLPPPPSSLCPWSGRRSSPLRPSPGHTTGRTPLQTPPNPSRRANLSAFLFLLSLQPQYSCFFLFSDYLFAISLALPFPTNRPCAEPPPFSLCPDGFSSHPNAFILSHRSNLSAEIVLGAVASFLSTFHTFPCCHPILLEGFTSSQNIIWCFTRHCQFLKPARHRRSSHMSAFGPLSTLYVKN